MKAYTEAFEFEGGGGVVVQFCETDEGISCKLRIELPGAPEPDQSQIPDVTQSLADIMSKMNRGTSEMARGSDERILTIYAETLPEAERKVGELIKSLSFLNGVIQHHAQYGNLQTYEA